MTFSIVYFTVISQLRVYQWLLVRSLGYTIYHFRQFEFVWASALLHPPLHLYLKFSTKFRPLMNWAAKHIHTHTPNRNQHQVSHLSSVPSNEADDVHQSETLCLRSSLPFPFLRFHFHFHFNFGIYFYNSDCTLFCQIFLSSGTPRRQILIPRFVSIQ